ncbi:hypothetical protein ACN6MY_09430 [Peribacillus sp. B-H-3]|jgi:hypothetical protein|uniref:hypothetical protein n=1 Tax=Peribacillus sp. B-H-3 TaxID=3400420 RepID=UPI003B023810
MQSLQDALYNWLTIKVVYDARPDDMAAQETKEFFEARLKEDHDASVINLEKNGPFYFVDLLAGGEKKRQRFSIELIDALLEQIEAEPDKYKNYNEE